MSNEQKTAAEILASVRSEAAPCGWGPVTRNGCSIEFARICGERIYGEVMLADGMYGFLWETDTGEEVEKCSSLVPLPAPPERDAEPERLRESTLLAFEIHASGDIRKMARECIASRRREAEQDMLIGLQRDEIGRLRAENKTLAESVCDLT
ncbi:MAG: hypothetical protein EHM42_11195, partial [Planctomycetaceae bacterium]